MKLICSTLLLAWSALSWATNPPTTPEAWGAYGDGVQGNTGQTASSSTAVLSDPNGQWTTFDVGKAIFVIAPPRSGSSSFYGTISGLTGCPGSGCQVTLSGNIGFTCNTGQSPACSISYYYGHTDNAAFMAATAAVSAGVTATGSQAAFNAIGNIDCLVLTGPKIYMLTQAAVINSAPGNAPCWRSDGGQATLAFGNIGNTTEVVTFGALPTGSGATVTGYTDDARLEGLTLDCTFTGQDCFSFVGFQNPVLERIHILNASVNCFAINPGPGQFLQQVHVKSLNIQYCGKDAINVNLAGGASACTLHSVSTVCAFANEMDFIDTVVGEVSVNTTGGTCFNFVQSGAGVDSWAFLNWKCTENWNGNATYQPSSHCIVFAPRGSGLTYNAPFAFLGIKFENGYCEEDGTNPLGASANPIHSDSTTNPLITFLGFNTSYWGPIAYPGAYPGLFNGSVYIASLAPNSGGTAFANIYLTGANYGYSGQCQAYVNDGTTGSYQYFTVVGVGGGTPQISNVVQDPPSGGIAAEYEFAGTVGSPNASGVQALKLVNLTTTGGSPVTLTASVQCQTLLAPGPPFFNWN